MTPPPNENQVPGDEAPRADGSSVPGQRQQRPPRSAEAQARLRAGAHQVAVRDPHFNARVDQLEHFYNAFMFVFTLFWLYKLVGLSFRPDAPGRDPAPAPPGQYVFRPMELLFGGAEPGAEPGANGLGWHPRARIGRFSLNPRVILYLRHFTRRNLVAATTMYLLFSSLLLFLKVRTLTETVDEHHRRLERDLDRFEDEIADAARENGGNVQMVCVVPEEGSREYEEWMNAARGH